METNDVKTEASEVTEDEQLGIDKKHTYIFTVSLSSKDIILALVALFKVVAFVVFYAIIKHSA